MRGGWDAFLHVKPEPRVESNLSLQRAADTNDTMPVAATGAPNTTVELEIFWQLASPSLQVRTEAAKRLASSLAKAQSDHEGEDMCGDLTYSLKRLARGLASSREGARHGFALALTSVLRTQNSVNTDEFFDEMLKLLEVCE